MLQLLRHDNPDGIVRTAADVVTTVGVDRPRLVLPPGLPAAGIVDLDLAARVEGRMHQPVRPAWTCSACSDPWPCDQARRDLLLDLGWLRLAIYCGALLSVAAGDLADVTPMQLWVRFLEWTRPLEGLDDPRLLHH